MLTSFIRIVDIAETCQEMFPFAAVAERHNQLIQKVFDTFSAIIQPPLLRNADDKRRHGSLGKRRVKEYRDAKRAMEKAQEVEREARLRPTKASANCSAPKKPKSKTPGLLKEAILNNARHSHSVSSLVAFDDQYVDHGSRYCGSITSLSKTFISHIKT
jgi:hypothetical protein